MIIDMTMPLKHGMAHYPGDPDIVFETVLNVSGGDSVNLKRLSFGSHSGTHVDAPYHLFPDGKKTSDFPVDYFIGTAKVFVFSSDIRAEHIDGLDINQDDIILFKTRSSLKRSDGDTLGDVDVLPCAAQYLADRRVRAVGIDTMSIENNPALETHRILLGAGIPILEALDLSGAAPGVYRMTAMILSVEDGDGAPMRAMLEK